MGQVKSSQVRDGGCEGGVPWVKSSQVKSSQRSEAHGDLWVTEGVVKSEVGGVLRGWKRVSGWIRAMNVEGPEKRPHPHAATAKGLLLLQFANRFFCAEPRTRPLRGCSCASPPGGFRRLGSGERVMERVRAVRQARGSDEATGRVHHPGEHVAQIGQRPRRRVAAAGAGAGVPHSHAVLRGGGLELSGQEGVRAPLDDDER